MYGIFALMGVLGTVVTMFLPESYKEDFPECIGDVERRKQYPFFSWKVWKYKKLEQGILFVPKIPRTMGPPGQTPAGDTSSKDENSSSSPA